MTIRRPGLYIALLLTLVTPVFLAPCLAAQSGNNVEDIFTISVAAPTSAKDIQVRYFFTGEFGGYGSSVADPIAGNKLVIKTGVEGKSAKTFKAIVYAPGCQFVTITVDNLTDANRQGDFQCQKLPTTELRGRVDTTELGEKDWQIEALYVCDWAMPFFGIKDGSISPLSLAKVTVAADGSFTIELPDFTADPTWPRLSNEAEFIFFLADSGTTKRMATLIAPSGLSRGGYLHVATSYPEVVFTIKANSN